MKTLQKNKAGLEELLQAETKKRYQATGISRGSCAVIYTRVSDQEQEGNSSLSTQKKYCEEYARRNNLIIKGYFGGKYESAKTDGRKEFQRMLSYVKKDKNISYIIVINYDRFSRTGPAAAQLSASLRSMGIIVKAVLQDIDTSTASGRLQENVFHVFNHFDNETKSERTKVNTKEVMLKGYWPYTTPLGYQNLRPKHRAYQHQYIITEEGKLLKKAFHLKAEGTLSNKEIVDRLSAQGLKLTEKNFRWILSNPFYAGYVTGKLVDGKLIAGKHLALIDLKTFLKVNALFGTATNAGIAKSHKREELPLKIFAKEDKSHSPFTGYMKKGNWYYKARAKGIGVNISAKKLNQYFENLLKQFEYNKSYKDRLKKAILEGLKRRFSEAMEQSVLLKKRASEVQSQLEKLEERFVFAEISKEQYLKFCAKLNGQLSQIKEELEKNDLSSSNLENAVTKMLQISENISQLWASANYNGKQKLQYLVFPDGIVYSKETDAVRTLRVNSLFAEIPLLKRDLGGNKKGSSNKNCLQSHSVPGTGIEPAHSCERQILSLLRLPIPPPGQSV
jgi:site-specific DNA recombinase